MDQEKEMREDSCAPFSPATYFFFLGVGGTEQKDHFHLGNFEDTRSVGQYSCRHCSLASKC